MATYNHSVNYPASGILWWFDTVTSTAVVNGTTAVVTHGDGSKTTYTGTALAVSGGVFSGTITGAAHANAAGTTIFETVAGASAAASSILGVPQFDAVSALLAGSDALSGSSANDVFLASTGNDSYTGGGGFDVIGYANTAGNIGISGPITVTYGSSGYSGTVVKSGGGGTDTFTGITGITGTAAGDTLIGSDDTTSNLPFFIQLRGNAGSDTIDGRKSTLNVADYSVAPAGVTVSLQTSTGANGNWFGTALDGQGGTDILKNVVRAAGSAFNDLFTGSDRNDIFQGSLGNDTYDGGLGSNQIRYNNFDSTQYSLTVTAGAPVAGLFGLGTMSIMKNPLAGGASSTDTATNVNNVYGTDGADTFVGTTAAYGFNAYNLIGGAGNDTIDGKGNTLNRVDYNVATSAVTVDLAAGTAQDGMGGTDTLVNVVRVRGSNFNDTILGAATNDVFQWADTGLHTANGRGGVNSIYFTGSGAVTIDLGTTLASDGSGGYHGTLTKAAGTETIDNFSNAIGGTGNDTIRGTADDNLLGGDAGNNTIDGRGGSDTLNYRVFTGNAPTHGATINLADGLNGTATNPFGGTDTLISMENAYGSVFADDITGAVLSDGSTSYIRGEGGNDTLRAPTAVANVTADYADSLSGVTVDLAAGLTSNDGWFGGQDTLVNIHAVRGSAFGDVLGGSSAADTLSGLAGDDVLTGGAGSDVIDGGDGNDTARFAGPASSYTVTHGTALDGSSTFAVVGPDGSDSLKNVEALQFVYSIQDSASISNDVLFFDTQGRITEDQLNFRDGHSQIAVYDAAGTQPWTTNNLLTDTQGNVTVNQLIFDDGHQQITVTDVANTQPWTVNNYQVDAQGKATVNQLIFDDGHQQITVNDVANTQPWTTNNYQLDAQGRATVNQLIYDDGHQVFTVNDTANTQPWATNNYQLDAQGRATVNQLIYDDGHQAITINDTINAQVWATNNLQLDAAGKLLVNQLIYDDGHQEQTTYDVANTQPYTSNSVLLDAQGHLVAYSTLFDDGHVEQFHI